MEPLLRRLRGPEPTEFASALEPVVDPGFDPAFEGNFEIFSCAVESVLTDALLATLDVECGFDVPETGLR